MKMKSIFAWLLALGMLSSCSKDDADSNGSGGANGAVAYLAVNVLTEGSRASIEDPGEVAESKINKLYLITFDASRNILAVPGNSTLHYLEIPGTVTDAQRVDANSKYLLVVANPGTKLLTAITNRAVGDSYTQLNAAIADVKVDEIVDGSKGFAMISSGKEDASLNPLDKIEEGLLDISSNIEKISDYPNVQQAQNAAQQNKANVKIERLATKIEVKEGSSIIKPTGATFTFGSWTLDAVNTTFNPYAVKTILAVEHTANPNNSYIKNFYTIDPNYQGMAVGTGLDINVIGADYKPKDPTGTTDIPWYATTAKEYRIENTMDAPEQKYGNATRVVIKAIYYPAGISSGDWFSFAGINYEDLDELQLAYAVPEATNLQAACDAMYLAIKNYAENVADPAISLTGTNFATLTVGDLLKIPDNLGGEIIKSTTKDSSGNVIPCIRWYQNGQNYYYYEIRHDNSPDAATMAFGKYGVVRNNWYKLTLNEVSGPGTPWYPDIDKPGPGDPDPEKPIDEDGAYLGIDLEVAPWILWETGFGI